SHPRWLLAHLLLRDAKCEHMLNRVTYILAIDPISDIDQQLQRIAEIVLRRRDAAFLPIFGRDLVGDDLQDELHIAEGPVGAVRLLMDKFVEEVIVAVLQVVIRGHLGASEEMRDMVRYVSR